MENNNKWVFLRGLIRGKGHWWNFTETFKKNFPEHEVELIDVAGNGDLYYQESFLSIEENVRDLRFRSEFLKKYERINLMTISLGSMIGIKWAEVFPTEVERLVCINTSDTRSPFYQRMSPPIYATIISQLIKPKKISKEEFILRATTNLLSDEQIKDMLAHNPHPHATSNANFLRQMAAASLFRAPDKKPIEDIIYFLSEKDHLVNPACSDRICKSWYLEPIVNSTAGHDLTTDDPQWVCDELKARLHDVL